MEGHRAERMTQADDDDPKAANKHWAAAPKAGLPKYNVPWTCSQREIGNLPRRQGASGPPQDLQWAAEDELILKNHEEYQCQLPATSRSTFLMVFSPDGTKVASTHGDHNVYVSDLPSGKGIRKLSGHPRTPWCLAFHPSSNQILASGCLGGQVRVWDLHGGSELWTAESHTVIASLAFHPTDRMLVVATYNELHFWDWSQPVPFAKCFTASEKEKVRYVTFDPLGHKLITGIANRTFVQSQWDRIPVSMSGPSHPPSSSSYPTTPLSHYSPSMPSTSSAGASSSSLPLSSSSLASTTSSTSSRPQTSSPTPSQGTSRSTSNSTSSSALPPSEQESRVTVCVRSLMEQYEQLVQRYYDLSRAQVVAGSSRESGHYVVPGTSGASNSASTTDRGTDPMEQESASSAAPGGSGQGSNAAQSGNTDSASSPSGLDSLRANLRRFRQPNFIHLPGCQRGRSGVTRVTSQTTAGAGRSESRGEDGAPPVPTREGVSRVTPGTRGDFLFRMMHLPNSARVCRVRGVATSYSPSTSSANTTIYSNADSTTPSVPSPGSRPFASVRSAFRPRLNTLRPLQQVALDLRMRSCHATTGTTNTTSTFSTSLRSAFQPRTSSSRNNGTATRGSSSGRQGSRFSLPPADVSVRFGIQLLSRHIDNMQRLCRARLEILQLQQIRRMWEDLQRQIGSLHATVRDGSGTPGPSPSPNASASSPHPSPPHSPPPSSSPPPRPSRPTLLPPSPPPIPPPPLSSPSSGEDEVVEPSPDPRAEDEEDGLRVRELMELARISGGEEPDSPSVGNAADGPSEASGDAGGGVSSGATASPFRDRPGNQTSRKRARIPSRFPEPGPSRRLRLVARMSTGSRPTNRVRAMRYPSAMLGIIQLRPQRRQEPRLTRCGPPYLYLQRLPEDVVSATHGARQPGAVQDGTSWQPEAEPVNESVAGGEGSGASGEPVTEEPVSEGHTASAQGQPNVEDAADESRDGEATARASNAQPPNETSGTTESAQAGSAAAEPSSSSGPTASQISSFRQAGEDFHGRFCSMISRLEVLVRQQRENRESYWRARGDALWSRREAGRPEGGGRGSSDSARGTADGPTFTLSDSSSDESDNSNIASPLARRILKKRHLLACQRAGWNRGMRDGEERPPFPPQSSPAEPSPSSPPPSTSSQLPTAPSTSSSVREEPSTSGGTPSDAEWQWTRESTRLRARQVLSMMVESLTQFFEQHGLSHETPHAILDEQIYNLYVLLQLALELTDLLLIQLMSTRRELEEQWVSSLHGTNSEGGNPQDSQAGRRTGPPPLPPHSPSTPHGQRLIRAITRSIFPSNWGDSEGSQRTAEARDGGNSAQPEAGTRPRRFFTVPEVQVNDVPVAPEAVSLLGEPPGGRSRARSPPPPVNIFVPVGGPRNVPTMSSSSVPSSRRGRPNPFVQLHQLRRLGAASSGLGGPGNGGSGTGGGAGGVGEEGRFRRFLHPRYVGPNPLGDEYREDPLQETVENILRDATMAVTHRIQAWDFSSCAIPEIGDGEQNVVVSECKIHNDASVDVSSDGRMLVALLPPGRLQINTMLGIYSLEWGNLGDCLFIMSLAQNAVSVSLSPTCRHLAVGLASRRVALLPSDRHTMAQLYRLESAPPYPSPPPSSTSTKGKGMGKGLRRGGNNNTGSTPSSSQVIGHLHHIRDIEQGRGQGYASLNCIRWMPVAGQGLVFGTNTGHLKVLR